jgi:hypothetical protein
MYVPANAVLHLLQFHKQPSMSSSPSPQSLSHTSAGENQQGIFTIHLVDGHCSLSVHHKFHAQIELMNMVPLLVYICWWCIVVGDLLQPLCLNTVVAYYTINRYIIQQVKTAALLW